MKLYSELAEYYFTIEEAGRKFAEEVQFLKDHFKKHKIQTVIDMGCGTGEHCKELQCLGFKPLGVDASPEMLGIASSRYPNCDFEQGKMEDYVTNQPADALICLFGTFNYLLEDDGVVQFLKNTNKNLKQAGLVVLEIWNSDPIQRIKRKPITTVSNVRKGDTAIRRNRGFRITREDNISLVEVNYIYNMNQKDLKDRHTMRVFSWPQVEAFLSRAKFDILQVFGNYNEEKYTKTGARMLILAKKRS